MKETIRFTIVDDPFAIDTQGRCWRWNGHKWQLTTFVDDAKFTWVEPLIKEELPSRKPEKITDDGGALGE